MEIVKQGQQAEKKPFALSGEYALVKRWKISLIVFAVLAFFFYPVTAWLQVAPPLFKGDFSIDFLFLHVMFVAMFFLCAPALFPLVFFKSSRPLFMYCSAFALIIILAPTAGCIVTREWQQNIRMAKMRSFTDRMQPLVDAIRKYKYDKGALPDSLKQLVPEYIPEIPSSGMLSYSNLKYHLHGGNLGRECLNNDWALTLDTPLGVMNWDMMVYLPNKNYPDNGFGGSLERIDDWAYVHE